MSPTRAGRGAREAVFRLLIESARADLTRWRHADMGLTLSAEGRLAQLPYASSESAVELFELQAATGEGPAVTAATEGLPVIVDLTRQRPGAWVTFAGEAQRRGITSICAVPLVAGAVRLGALTAHRQRADPADPRTHPNRLRSSTRPTCNASTGWPTSCSWPSWHPVRASPPSTGSPSASTRPPA